MLKFWCSIVLAMIYVTASCAETFKAGQDYVELQTQSSAAQAKHRVSVTEFFNYGCPWCFKIEPALNQWIKQKKQAITFTKVPVIYNKDWEIYAKAFYTVDALGLTSSLNPVLFNAIIKDKRPLNQQDSMIKFLQDQGIDKSLLKSAFEHSPSIDLQIQESKKMMGLYQVNAIPAFVIGNRFKTDLQMAKTEDRLFAILDFLINKSQENPIRK